MKIEVEGVELMITQDRGSVTVSRVVGRDRKRKLDITSARTFRLGDAAGFVTKLKQVAKLQTARCTCDYRYGFSDHAEHCRSVYVAEADLHGSYD